MVIHKNLKYYINKFLIYFILLLLTFLTLSPFIIMILTSLKSSGSIITNISQLFTGKFTFQNYVDVWVDDSFGKYFVNSLIVTIFIIIGNVIFDSMAGYVLSRKKFKLKKIVFILILCRMMIPIQVLIILLG